MKKLTAEQEFKIWRECVLLCMGPPSPLEIEIGIWSERIKRFKAWYRKKFN